MLPKSATCGSNDCDVQLSKWSEAARAVGAIERLGHAYQTTFRLLFDHERNLCGSFNGLCQQ